MYIIKSPKILTYNLV